MLQVTLLNQQNYKNKLGFSKYTIASHGCTLTCLTMLYNYVTGKMYTPAHINDKLKTLGNYDPRTNTKGAFQGALLVWSNVFRVLPELKFVARYYNYNNLVASEYVYLKKMPVMAEVNGAKIGASKHWCLLLGDKKMADPWTGRVETTAKYPLTGLGLYKRA